MLKMKRSVPLKLAINNRKLKLGCFAKSTLELSKAIGYKLRLKDLKLFRCIHVVYDFVDPETQVRSAISGPAEMFVRVISADRAIIAIVVPQPVIHSPEINEAFWKYTMALQTIIEQRDDFTLCVSAYEAWQLRHPGIRQIILRCEELENDFDGAVYLDYESLTFSTFITGKTFGELIDKAESIVIELHNQAVAHLTSQK